MATPTATKMTVEEYWTWSQLPENADRRTELVDGEVIEMPPPGVPHGDIAFAIAGIFYAYFQVHGPGFGTTNDSGVVVAPDAVRRPDLMLFRRARRAEDRAGWATSMPTLCVEVVSPSDRPGKSKSGSGSILRPVCR